MIIDRLEHIGRYRALSPLLARAAAVLESGGLEDRKPGRYEIDGDRLFALVKEYEPANTPSSRYEAHREYIDLQYCVAGGERVGYAPVGDLREAAPYDGGKDCTLYEGAGSFLTLRPGMFFIAFPQDAHLPEVADGAGMTRKIIFKVRVDG